MDAYRAVASRDSEGASVSVSANESPVPLFPKEPSVGGWGSLAVFDDLLRWMVAQGASDVKLLPTGPVMLAVSGQWWAVTRAAPSSGDIASLVDSASRRANTSARVAGGKSEDFSYEVAREAGDRRSGHLRFRCNATACMTGRGAGISLTLRAIPDRVPRLTEIGIPDELREHLFPAHGLVSISGVMGSGKTTTLAAIIEAIRTQDRRAVMTLEKPIEFDYTNIPGALGPIEQIEVPRMIESFSEGIVSATRKATNVLLVGETNDRTTMEAMIHAAEIGIGVYHTIHTQSVSAIPGRIIHQFGADEAPGIAASFLGSCRVLIQQRLVPKVGGGRVALREWLALDDGMRQILVDTPIEKLYVRIEGMLKEAGRPLLTEAAAAHAQGLIDDRVLNQIKREKERRHVV